MPNPIDSYRIGGNGLVHFYAGNQPVLSAHVDSPSVSAKIRDIDAARGGAPPVADLDAAYRRSEGDTGPRHAERLSGQGELDAARRILEPSRPQMPPGPPPPMSALDAAYARQQADTGPRFGPPPGGPPPGMPPPGAMPPGPMGGGPPMPPPGPPPGPPGAMPMGAGPPPMSALDEAYRRQMADTGSRFGGR